MCSNIVFPKLFASNRSQQVFQKNYKKRATLGSVSDRTDYPVVFRRPLKLPKVLFKPPTTYPKNSGWFKQFSIVPSMSKNFSLSL